MYMNFLAADIVGDHHFGGFFTEKDPAKSEGEMKSWKEKMEELISKTRKERVCVCGLSVFYDSYATVISV
jgi:hypothetical protein